MEKWYAECVCMYMYVCVLPELHVRTVHPRAMQQLSYTDKLYDQWIMHCEQNRQHSEAGNQ